MSQLTSDSILFYDTNASLQTFGVLANVKVYRGSAIGSSSGYARQLVAGDKFMGFAEETVDNTVGAAANGSLSVTVRANGNAQLNITSAAITDVGKAVYASDGGTFTYTGTSNSRIGTVVRWVSTGVVIVSFNAYLTTNVVPAITDSTGGTPSATFAAIAAGSSYAQADIVAIKNALSEIALILNTMNQGTA